MHKYLWLFVLITVIGCGCENKVEIVDKEKLLIEGPGFSMTSPIEILVYDECEYIVIKNGSHLIFTHKGNCKYCEQRCKQ